MAIYIQQPELFHLDDGGMDFYYGGKQVWYPQRWQRQAGCGPTAGAHLLWYLSRTREGMEPLCPYDAGTRKGMLRLMEETWRFITPTTHGVNKTSILTEGAMQFGHVKNIPLTGRVLDVPIRNGKRPSETKMTEFLSYAMLHDRPVAFLNLSNGRLTNLDNWHWVTLVGWEKANGTALMYDQGRKTTIDLFLWLASTTMGGGFVTIDRKEQDWFADERC